MSHTDKTRPFWVKLGDSPGNYVPKHDHRHGDCDLPEFSRDYWRRDTRCTWTWTSEWINSPDARCDCKLCRGSIGRRVDNRKARYSARSEIDDQRE